MNDRHIAKILRIGLLLNYFTPGQVERWCEQRLLLLDGPKADPFIKLYTSLHLGLPHTLIALADIQGKSSERAESPDTRAILRLRRVRPPRVLAPPRHSSDSEIRAQQCCQPLADS